MTHAELRATLAALGWTTRGLARFLGRPEPSVLNWLSPTRTVPPDVAAWLTRRLAFHQRMMQDDPPP